MKTLSFTIFETRLGWIGLAWNETALVRLFMPQNSSASIAARIDEVLPDAEQASDLPDFIGQVISELHRYAAGEQIDFSNTPVDFGAIDQTRQAIYTALRALPYGGTLTYGELATEAGYAGMAREIGQAMGKNPVPIIVPCHRIVAASGKLGGFSAPGGTRTKEKLLALEHAKPLHEKTPQTSFAF